MFERKPSGRGIEKGSFFGQLQVAPTYIVSGLVAIAAGAYIYSIMQTGEVDELMALQKLHTELAARMTSDLPDCSVYSSEALAGVIRDTRFGTNGNTLTALKGRVSMTASCEFVPTAAGSNLTSSVAGYKALKATYTGLSVELCEAFVNKLAGSSVALFTNTSNGYVEIRNYQAKEASAGIIKLGISACIQEDNDNEVVVFNNVAGY